MAYEKGHVKRHSETGEVAMRTRFPLGETVPQQMMEWSVISPHRGPRHTWTQEVEDEVWVDLYVAEATQEN